MNTRERWSTGGDTILGSVVPDILIARIAERAADSYILSMVSMSFAGDAVCTRHRSELELLLTTILMWVQKREKHRNGSKRSRLLT